MKWKKTNQQWVKIIIHFFRSWSYKPTKMTCLTKSVTNQPSLSSDALKGNQQKYWAALAMFVLKRTQREPGLSGKKLKHLINKVEEDKNMEKQ